MQPHIAVTSGEPAGIGPELCLRLAGYDGALSIEHEDSILSVNEGFTRAVSFLKDSVITEQTGGAWWV